MKKNEKYWLNLYKAGQVKIDFKTGQVFSFLSGEKRLLGRKNSHGYLRASAGISRADRNYILLHRLIWLCFYGNIVGKLEINHKNGIKYDNRLENLELVTKSENALHSHRVLGNKSGVSYGEDSKFAKITWEEVKRIRSLYHKEKYTILEIQKMCILKKSQIWNIVDNKSWIKEKEIM